MKASKFTDAQKAFVIKQGEEGTPVAEVCRKAGISQATYFNWKKKYAGLMASEMRRLRELERFSTVLNHKGFPRGGFSDSESVLVKEASMDGSAFIVGFACPASCGD